MIPTLRAVLAVLLLLLSCAHAGTLADLHVVSRSTGQRMPVYSHGGKLYVAGQPGERYSVQVVNRTARRILAVVSVDGVNVVNGETASPDQSGYVFSPGQAYDIAGWRKNANEVAAFYFTSLPDSYAARTDRPNDVGVIGVAVFREWAPPPRPVPQLQPRALQDSLGAAQDTAKEARSANSSAPADAAKAEASERAAPGAPAMRSQEKLGTGHGEREQSAVTFTDFRRATSYPSEVLTIYYDRYENLVARGIIPSAPALAQPRPFPGVVRFVPDPRS